MLALVALGLMLAGGAAESALAPQEHAVEIRIQGNYRTSEDDVRRIAAVQVGDPVDEAAVAAIKARLEKSGRFDEIEIRKRWRTLDISDEVVLVIIVREIPGGSSNAGARVVRSLTHPLVLPILNYQDGYGITFGANLSPVNLLDKNTHVSIPLTWGATKQATLELEHPFTGGPFSRANGTFSFRQRNNPFYDIDDTRLVVGGRLERSLGQSLRLGASTSLSDVSFGEIDHGLFMWGGDVAFDTRRTPELPRNAVYLQLGWDMLHVNDQHDAAAGVSDMSRYRADARAYVGLIGSSVVAIRAFRGAASDRLPDYEQFLLGGAASLRGFRAGYDAGDKMVNGSVELRVPLTSPVSFGRIGMSVFGDTGTVYATGESLEQSHFRNGVGIGLFFNAAIFNLNLDAAKGINRGYRFHLSTGFQF